MRTELMNIGSEERLTFKGVFERFGMKRGWKGRTETTVLLTDIRDADGDKITDHLWFNLTKGFSQTHLEQGDIIQFEARVDTYLKGYQGYRMDVDKPVELDAKLSRPTKIKKVGSICLPE